MQTATAQLDSINEETVTAMEQQKLEASEELNAKVLPLCEDVKQRVDTIRGMLECQISSISNPFGCLSGDLDEYLESYETHLKKLKARLLANIEMRKVQLSSVGVLL